MRTFAVYSLVKGLHRIDNLLKSVQPPVELLLDLLGRRTKLSVKVLSVRASLHRKL